MGIICTWESFVPGNSFYRNQINPGVLFAGTFFQERFGMGANFSVFVAFQPRFGKTSPLFIPRFARPHIQKQLWL
jgi:hypothetical protein